MKTALSKEKYPLRSGTRVVFDPYQRYSAEYPFLPYLKKGERYIVAEVKLDGLITLRGFEGDVHPSNLFILQPWETPGWSLPDSPCQKIRANPLSRGYVYGVGYKTGDVVYFGSDGVVFSVKDREGRIW